MTGSPSRSVAWTVPMDRGNTTGNGGGEQVGEYVIEAHIQFTSEKQIQH